MEDWSDVEMLICIFEPSLGNHKQCVSNLIRIFSHTNTQVIYIMIQSANANAAKAGPNANAGPVIITTTWMHWKRQIKRILRTLSGWELRTQDWQREEESMKKLGKMPQLVRCAYPFQPCKSFAKNLIHDSMTKQSG